MPAVAKKPVRRGGKKKAGASRGSEKKRTGASSRAKMGGGRAGKAGGGSAGKAGGAGGSRVASRLRAAGLKDANYTTLAADTNQALGLGQFAIDFMSGMGAPGASVLERTNLFHVDAVFCGLSAIALNTNSPRALREEALDYEVGFARPGATIFGSRIKVAPEKAVVANSAAVREWDSNGTNFGFNPALKHTAGEFGHNDFYPVALAAAQMRGLDGATALRGMILIDEIRGRLAEVFSLKSYKIDHVVHGAIGSAAAFGAMMGATAEQIESAIGMVVAHYIPWRAIRAGKQLSDSKGASAAISTEMAVLSVLRSMRGFVGPRDIFRNPEAIFRFFEPTTRGKDRWKEQAPSPFDLVLAHSGEDFAVMGMHFKMGLYEHQSAGALQGAIDLICRRPGLVADATGKGIKRITILAYEPAFGIIGNPAKMDPKTRQSADHSMAYIVATLLRKAIEISAQGEPLPAFSKADSNSAAWKALMLTPRDYREDETALFHPLTRSLMQRVRFEHGGPSYDRKYPDGIPTSIVITDHKGVKHDSKLVMYPAGHARNRTADLKGILQTKFARLGRLASDDAERLIERFDRLETKSAAEVRDINDFSIRETGERF